MLALFLAACTAPPPCARHLDRDGDGFGDAASPAICAPGVVTVANADDCDDTDPAVHPGAKERCAPAGVDDDCDGRIDDADTDADRSGGIVVWPDADGDGFGDLDVPGERVCVVSDGVATVAGDCDDTAATTFPGAAPLDDPDACLADADGDGWGDPHPPAGVTWGRDCDDADPGVHPGAREALADDVDQDCDGADRLGLFDDFDAGQPDSGVWASMVGDVRYLPHGDGSWLSLGDACTLTTRTVDASTCSHLSWSLQARRSAYPPDPTEDLVLQYDDGTGWVPFARLLANGNADGITPTWSGMLDDAAALPSFRVQLAVSSIDGGDSEWLLDDLAIACSGPDDDGDGVPAERDCDDAAPDHWDDCGVCDDLDGDGFGPGCDLGDDCEPAAADAHPGAPDAFDGRDTDCDGFDGDARVDGFDRGYPDPTQWATLSNTETPEHAPGDFVLSLDSLDRAELAPMDASGCAAVSWSYRGLGRAGPDQTDRLTLSFADGTGWVPVDVWHGNGVDEVDWIPRSGTVTDARALRDGVRWRLDAFATGPHVFKVDDLAIGCAP
ncbi:MAG: putative metal-binding motif-containing protein [Myxococcota bacterium]